MIPEGHPDIKVYLQKKTVKYADYKIGKLYVAPDLLMNFKDPERLFFKMTLEEKLYNLSKALLRRARLDKVRRGH